MAYKSSMVYPESLEGITSIEGVPIKLVKRILCVNKEITIPYTRRSEEIYLQWRLIPDGSVFTPWPYPSFDVPDDSVLLQKLSEEERVIVDNKVSERQWAALVYLAGINRFSYKVFLDYQSVVGEFPVDEVERGFISHLSLLITKEERMVLDPVFAAVCDRLGWEYRHRKYFTRAVHSISWKNRFNSDFLEKYKEVVADKEKLSPEIQNTLAEYISLANEKISMCLAVC
jgi:hypothetical protein